jgi:hypothetical protein
MERFLANPRDTRRYGGRPQGRHDGYRNTSERRHQSGCGDLAERARQLALAVLLKGGRTRPGERGAIIARIAQAVFDAAVNNRLAVSGLAFALTECST